jgi:hypothetical protein
LFYFICLFGKFGRGNEPCDGWISKDITIKEMKVVVKRSIGRCKENWGGQ